MLDLILELLRKAWAWLKKIWVKVCSFFKNIVAFFKDKYRLAKLQRNSDLIAVAIKQKLDNKEYNVVNCLFDKAKGEIQEADTLVVQSESLDMETRQQFGNQDMIILN